MAGGWIRILGYLDVFVNFLLAQKLAPKMLNYMVPQSPQGSPVYPHPLGHPGTLKNPIISGDFPLKLRCRKLCR